VNREETRPTTRGDLLLALAAVLASLVYFLSYFRYGYMEDEGYLVEGVSRILEGQVIYHDFHHTYAPGRFYLFALLFSVFGKNLLVVRATWAVLLAIKAGMAYWVGRKLTSRSFGLMLAFLVTLVPGPWHKTPFAFSAFLMISAMICLIDRPGIKTYLGIGILTGLTALLRQDVAGFGAIGILIVIALSAREDDPGLRRGLLLRRAGAYVLGILLPVLPVLIAFGAAGALGDMFRGVLLEGMRDNRTNRLPFPSLWPVTEYGGSHAGPVVLLKSFFYLAPVVFVIAAARSLLRAVRREFGASDRVVVGILVLSAGCFNQSLWRSDFPHLYQSLQPAYLVLVVLLHSLFSRIRSRISIPWVRGVALTALLLLPAVYLGGPLVWGCRQISEPRAYHALRAEGLYIRSVEYTGSALVRGGQSVPLDLDRAPLIVTEGRAAFLRAVGDYLDENTDPGDPVLSVPGFQLVYFLFDRKNPTRHIHVRRSLGKEEEEAFIRDVIRADTRLILYTEMAIDGKRERRFPIYARSIYDWIMEHYETDAVYGNLLFLERRGHVGSPSNSGGLP